MAGAISNTADSFRDLLSRQELPDAMSALSPIDIGVSTSALIQIVESQFSSRCLDLWARQLGAERKTFYSIGSAGHEANAATAHALRVDDMAFLHYRSGAFFIERSKQISGQSPIYDMALSFAASADDPISGGRHKVIGSKPLFIPPQTSTIASHLPKAVGTAFSVGLARKLKKQDATLGRDGLVFCSFGDASANHSTAQGAFNAAALCAHKRTPLPIIFQCEDNGIGISVQTPENWIEAQFANRHGLAYIRVDGRDMLGVIDATRRAARHARCMQAPVFLHLATTRLYGHAGSDVETSYRRADEIAKAQREDPLLHSARMLVEHCGMSLSDVGAMYDEAYARTNKVFSQAIARPKLSTSQEVMAPISGPGPAPAPKKLTPQTLVVHASEKPAPKNGAHMSRAIAHTLSTEMQADQNIVVFGEDVGHKGGVYGATHRLQKMVGPVRVFDTHLDEQSILGLAIGLAHNGFLPIAEIQFLAYIHNAEDQLRGEAATLSFFSQAQFSNPMIIRIAGLAYQKGFGGHFHNDNSLAIFRDIPGIIMACPSSAEMAERMLKTALGLARTQRRIIVMIEPIALYPVKDLYDDNDDLMLSDLGDNKPPLPFGAVQRFGRGSSICVLTYGNGVYMARRCAKRIDPTGIHIRIIDLCWLSPLPIDAVMQEINACGQVLIVDECRKSGSISEELITHIYERSFDGNLRRLTARDSFVPLGPAANSVLISEDEIDNALKAMIEAANTSHEVAQ